jgi:replication-associated recombination protein RarA
MNIIDKHIPRTLEDVVFVNESDAFFIKQFVAGNHHIDNLLLYGPRGTAKSTTAQIIAREVTGGTGLLLNDSLDSFLKRGSGIKEYLYNTTFFLADPASQHRRCVIVVDEIDKYDKLEKLWTVMDENSDTFMLIATTNHVMSIDMSLRSRCMICEFDRVTHEQFLPRAKQILSSEKIDLDDQMILLCLKLFCLQNYDIRDQMRVLQQISTMQRAGLLQNALANARRSSMKVL